MMLQIDSYSMINKFNLFVQSHFNILSLNKHRGQQACQFNQWLLASSQKGIRLPENGQHECRADNRIINKLFVLKVITTILRLLQRMDSIVPIQYIKNHFHTPIKHLQQSHRSANSIYFIAITNYGTMSLVLENYTRNLAGRDTIKFLQSRNQLIRANPNYFPAIYQQNICVNHPQQIACISLIENAQHVWQPLHTQANKIRIGNLKKFVNCLNLLQKHQLAIQGPLQSKDLLYFANQQQVNFDFTQIVPHEGSKNTRLLEQLQKCIQDLLVPPKEEQRQVILIQDKLYLFDSSLLKEAADFQQVLFMLNLCPNLNVEIELKTILKSKIAQEGLESPVKLRKKLIKVEQLQGKQRVKVGQKQYINLVFIEGKCMNSLRELGEKEQNLSIFQKKCHLRMRKRQHIYLQVVREETDCDIITVEEEVQKIEFISFIICYMRIREPVISSICYVQRKNCLKIDYTNKAKQERTLKIMFYPGYVVKDEEISMILQRAKLKNCKVDLRFMKINDTLLMFLANSQKTAKISEIHISDCYGITDNGINALVMSPFCKKMQALTLVLDENLFQASIQSLSLRQELKKLHLEHNKKVQQHRHDVEVKLEKLKIAQLSSIGIKISLSHLNLQNLKILKISQPVHIDELKLLRNSMLTQLKIRLIQLNKKNIIETTSSFLTGTLINRNNPARIFAEGSSSKSLKIVDLSNSSVKFKSIKYLFNMPQVQKLILNECTHFGQQFEPISPKILHLSLVKTQVSISNLCQMLEKTSILVEINLIGNRAIGKQELVNYIENKKKFINNLIVCENCYSHKLIQKMGGNGSNDGFQLVENVALSVGRLANEQKQDILYDILGKVIETPKILKLITDPTSVNEANLQKLISKIEIFTRGCGKSKKHFKNLYINSLRFAQALELHARKMQLFDPSNLPLQQINSNTSIISISQSYTIQKLTHKIRTLPASIEFISLNLKDNKIIDKESIKMLQQQVGNKLTQINFRNCMFSFNEVIEYLFQFPMLSDVNEGVCSLRIDGENFATHSQQYLKFFMKLREISQLTIECTDIEESQLLFSVLYHIVDKHAGSLTKLSVQLTGLTVNNDGQIFIAKIFDLSKLAQLTLSFSGCHFINVNKKDNCFDGLNQLNQLRILRLKLGAFAVPALNFKNLEEVSICFSDSQVNEQDMNKVMKNLFWCPIKKLQLDFSRCPYIANLNKMFSLGPSSTLVQKLHNLEQIRINLEHCPLKQHSVYELLHAIGKCPRIKKIQLNVSFTITNLNELVNKIHSMILSIAKEVKVYVICVTPNSAQFSYNRSYFEPNGVTFTF